MMRQQTGVREHFSLRQYALPSRLSRYSRAQRLSFGRDLGERAVAIEHQPSKQEAPAKGPGL